MTIRAKRPSKKRSHIAAQRDDAAGQRDAAIALLASWRTEDEQEQRETWQQLRRTLDEDRLSDRSLFP